MGQPQRAQEHMRGLMFATKADVGESEVEKRRRQRDAGGSRYVGGAN